MVPKTLPKIIKENCEEFVLKFKENLTEALPDKLYHKSDWKESEEKLVNITKGILDVLKDAWNNPAFSPQFVDSQSEGTYLLNIIVPMIRAALVDLSFGKSSYIST